METARDAKLDQAQEAAEVWIFAAVRFHHICRILEDTGEPDSDGNAKGQLIHQLAHFQYGTELSHSRLLASQSTENPPPGEVWSFAPMLYRAADAHHLLNSASGFWRTLRRLCKLMPFREPREMLEEEADTIADTQAARNHMEHIAERITEGRGPQKGFPEMGPDTFQRAVGRIEFPHIVFGTEAFNLDGIASAVLSVGLRLSHGFNELLNSGIEAFNNLLIEATEASANHR